MKPVPYLGPVSIRLHDPKFSCPADLEPRICTAVLTCMIVMTEQFVSSIVTN
jgi:hypothetical protein